MVSYGLIYCLRWKVVIRDFGDGNVFSDRFSAGFIANDRLEVSFLKFVVVVEKEGSSCFLNNLWIDVFFEFIIFIDR